MKGISIHTGRIVFEYDAYPQTDAFVLPDAKPRIDQKSPQSKRILLWEASQGLAVRVSRSEDMHLSKSRSVDVNILSGWNDISAGTVTFRAASAGLRLHTAQAKVDGAALSLMNDTQPGSISFAQIPSGNRLKISTPYSLEVDLTEIAIRAEVVYTTQKGQFTYITRPNIPISLPLAVNVQDIFKEDALFSCFTIRSANSMPMQIDESKFEGNDDFQINAPPSSDSKVDVFSDQPFSLFAEIRRNPVSRKWNGEKGIDNKIHLTIKYHCLDQILFAIVEAELLEFLATAQLHRFSRLLSQHLVDRLQNSLVPHDFETFGLMKELDLGSLERFGWDDILQALPPHEAAQVLDLLQNSHLVSQRSPLN